MTEKHPNIRRPIETAPKDGTKILLWFSDKYARVCSYTSFGWVADGGAINFIPTHWSPVPEDEAPKYCCDNFLRYGDFFKGCHWPNKIGIPYTHTPIVFCPFCGEKLK